MADRKTKIIDPPQTRQNGYHCCRQYQLCCTPIASWCRGLSHGARVFQAL